MKTTNGNCRIHPRFSIFHGRDPKLLKISGGAVYATSNCIDRCSCVNVRPSSDGAISPRTERNKFKIELKQTEFKIELKQTEFKLN